jgi:hypothetical protein
VYWLNNEHNLFRYYLDTRPCDGNTLLKRGPRTGIRVWLYRTTKGVGCEFLGEFRVESVNGCTKAYVCLRQHPPPPIALTRCGPPDTLPSRNVVPMSPPPAVATENMHYVVLEFAVVRGLMCVVNKSSRILARYRTF